ncbi:uncharacterized protein LOC135106219 [Scylla paramamosain]|uniref:uncharacterized protein LOC135106219 n=1 Tax=Scylla paramamosain TaxID=85552 RepID=UPI0030831A7D
MLLHALPPTTLCSHPHPSSHATPRPPFHTIHPTPLHTFSSTSSLPRPSMSIHTRPHPITPSLDAHPHTFPPHTLTHTLVHILSTPTNPRPSYTPSHLRSPPHTLPRIFSTPSQHHSCITNERL